MANLNLPMSNKAQPSVKHDHQIDQNDLIDVFNLKSNILVFQTLHFVSEIHSRLSSQDIPHFTVNLQKGDMLYIPQMWWQLLTLPSDPILFVQFLWPSRMQTSSVVQSSFKTRGKSEHVCKFFGHGVIGKIKIKMPPL